VMVIGPPPAAPPAAAPKPLAVEQILR
jgi:hypothetical protein